MVAQRTELNAKDWKKAVLVLHQEHKERSLKRRPGRAAAGGGDAAAVAELQRQKVSKQAPPCTPARSLD